MILIPSTHAGYIMPLNIQLYVCNILLFIQRRKWYYSLIKQKEHEKMVQEGIDILYTTMI